VNALLLLALALPPQEAASDAAVCSCVSPIPGAQRADHLIQPGEEHFAHLWKLTAGGENAEGYFSFDGDRLVLQRKPPGAGCDRIFVTHRHTGELLPVSSGRGATTCAYFLPGDRSVIFASTQRHVDDCPPPLDFSQGYVWAVHPEYDLWVHDLATGEERSLTEEWGYDAEATVSPRGDRIVFTSTRSGDLELWTCDLDGSNPVQVTDAIGYDGGAFFSHDGKRLVFRSTQFTPGKEAEEQATYRALLADWKVRPQAMEIMLIDADGSNRTQLTHLGGASFAPYFFPDDRRVIFSTNHHAGGGGAGNFDLFAIGVDGEGLERITTYDGFDSFPMFAPDGAHLVFASNRGGEVPGETNLFVAQWR
jgi:hypothetical protein